MAIAENDGFFWLARPIADHRQFGPAAQSTSPEIGFRPLAGARCPVVVVAGPPDAAYLDGQVLDVDSRPVSDDFNAILDFWFGELDPNGCADAEHVQRWWKKDTAFDEHVRRHFASEHRAVSSGERDDWLSEPRGRLASIIVLDQFSRNMFRGTSQMFDYDVQARLIATTGIDLKFDSQLQTDERAFFYMPLMHSENIADQERSVALWTQCSDETSAELRERVGNTLGYAIQHRDIVARFGRFPHRNEILGRPSTEVELEFLAGPGSSF